MAVLGFEGFEELISPTPVNSLVMDPKWALSNINLTSEGNNNKIAGMLGGSAIQWVSSQGNYLFTPGGSYTTLIVGGRYLCPNVNSGVPYLLQFVDGSSAQCGIAINTSRQLFVFRGGNGTPIATGSTVLTVGAWYFIEFKVTFSTSGNSDGSYELRIGGVTELSASGTADVTTTTNNSATGVALMWHWVGTNAPAWDDFYLCDDSGGVADDFLGVIRVETLFPAANDTVAFTASAGANYTTVDEASINSDTDYNSSTVSGDVDLFTVGSLSSTPDTIYAVGVKAAMRKDDVAAQTVRTKLKSGATTSNGSSGSPDTVYKYFRDNYAVDPNTSAAWTGTNVNAMKIGYEHV